MVKLRATFGSGASNYISGWIQLFFPYLKGDNNLNQNLRPWDEMYFIGPDPANIPPIVSSAPVDWDYYGKMYNLHFVAGFAGCSQDPHDGTLTPEMGWFVVHDPPEEPMARLGTIETEIMALLKGHSDDMTGDVTMDREEPWYQRITVLAMEHKSIKEGYLSVLEQEKGQRLRKLDRHGYRPQDAKERVKVEDEILMIEGKITELHKRETLSVLDGVLLGYK